MGNTYKKDLERTKFESLCRDYIPRNINNYRVIRFDIFKEVVMDKVQAKEKFETICKTYIPRKINDYRIEWQLTSDDKNEVHGIGTIIFHLRMCAYGKYGKKDDRTLDYRIYTDSDLMNQVDIVLRNDLRSDLFNYLEVMNRI